MREWEPGETRARDGLRLESRDGAGRRCGSASAYSVGGFARLMRNGDESCPDDSRTRTLRLESRPFRPFARPMSFSPSRGVTRPSVGGEEEDAPLANEAERLK